MMMDDSAPTHERRKLVKTYKKNVIPLNRFVVAVACEETYSKNEKNKRATPK